MQKETFMNKQNPPPDSNRNSLTSHIDLLLKSYKKWTGKELTDINGEPGQIAEHIFNAPFALVSHDMQDDPVFNYGNRTALELFELDWDEFTKLHSRESAEPVNREERARFLKRVTENGFIDDYRGIRISSSGRRFEIRDATVWNVVDEEGNYKGQAAFFDKWKFL